MTEECEWAILNRDIALPVVWDLFPEDYDSLTERQCDKSIGKKYDNDRPLSWDRLTFSNFATVPLFASLVIPSPVSSTEEAAATLPPSYAAVLKLGIKRRRGLCSRSRRKPEKRKRRRIPKVWREIRSPPPKLAPVPFPPKKKKPFASRPPKLLIRGVSYLSGLPVSPRPSTSSEFPFRESRKTEVSNVRKAFAELFAVPPTSKSFIKEAVAGMENKEMQESLATTTQSQNFEHNSAEPGVRLLQRVAAEKLRRRKRK